MHPPHLSDSFFTSLEFTHIQSPPDPLNYSAVKSKPAHEERVLESSHTDEEGGPVAYIGRMGVGGLNSNSFGGSAPISHFTK